MIHPLSVSFELRRIKVYLSEIPGAVAHGLVVEVRRRRIAALATRGDCSRAHAFTELDDGDEAVAAGAVPFLRSGIWAGSERCQRSPSRRGERNRNAWSCVVELRKDVVGDALESIDLSPRRLPATEILLEPRSRGGERLKALRICRALDHVGLARHCSCAGFGTNAIQYIFSPEHGERRRNRISPPAIIPVTERSDLTSEARLEWIARGKLVVRLEQSRNHPRKGGQPAVVRGRDEGRDGEIFFLVKNAQCVAAAR